MLTTDTLFQSRPRRTRTFEFPEEFDGLAGQQFTVQAMDARERAAFETQFSAKSDKSRRERLREARERLIIATLVDGQGRLMLTVADLPRLSQMDCAVIDFMAQGAKQLNRIGEEDLEAVAKNSDATPAGSSL